MLPCYLHLTFNCMYCTLYIISFDENNIYTIIHAHLKFKQKKSYKFFIEYTFFLLAF